MENNKNPFSCIVFAQTKTAEGYAKRISELTGMSTYDIIVTCGQLANANCLDFESILYQLSYFLEDLGLNKISEVD